MKDVQQRIANFTPENYTLTYLKYFLFLKIYLLIFGCIGSSLLCACFL